MQGAVEGKQEASRRGAALGSGADVEEEIGRGGYGNGGWGSSRGARGGGRSPSWRWQRACIGGAGGGTMEEKGSSRALPCG